jgi:microcystin-dependent protein
MPGHYTNTSSIVANSNISASTLRGILDDLDDATYAVESANVLAMPPGSITAFAGSTEPVGWLFCYGQQISRASYAALFAVIGTTYGVGDGSTTFNLPDMRGRVPLAKDNLGGASANVVTNVAADTLGGKAGSETHTLTTSELASHRHTAMRYKDSGGNIDPVTGPGGEVAFGGLGHNAAITQTRTTGIPIIETYDAGGGGAHANMQPYIALNYIIKT